MKSKVKIFVTQDGYNQYIEALKESEVILSEKLRERIGSGKNRVGADGDYQTGVSDNEVALVANNISRLKEEISRLEIVSKENLKESQVDLGDIVTLLHTDTNEIGQVKLTGGMPIVGIGDKINSITINSPMGKAIYKKSVGDIVSYFVNDRSGNRREFTIQIISKENGLEKEEPQPE